VKFIRSIINLTERIFTRGFSDWAGLCFLHPTDTTDLVVAAQVKDGESRNYTLRWRNGDIWYSNNGECWHDDEGCSHKILESTVCQTCQPPFSFLPKCTSPNPSRLWPPTSSARAPNAFNFCDNGSMFMISSILPSHCCPFTST